MKEVTVNELEFGECYQIVSGDPEQGTPLTMPGSEHIQNLDNPVFMYLGKMKGYSSPVEPVKTYALLAMTNSKKGYLHVCTEWQGNAVDKIFAVTPKK